MLQPSLIRSPTLLTRLPLIALASLLPLAAHANHVDFVEDAPFALFVDGGTPSNSLAVSGSSTNILGAEREIFLEGGESGSINAQTTPSATDPDGVDAIAASSTTDAATVLELLYDGPGAAGLGGLDFAASWDSIALEVSSTVFSWEAAVEVEGGGAIGAATKTVSAPGTFFFSFSDPGYTGVDFSSVDAVAVIFTSLDPGAGMTLESITREVAPAPEPGAVALLIAIMVALLPRAVGIAPTPSRGPSRQATGRGRERVGR